MPRKDGPRGKEKNWLKSRRTRRRRESVSQALWCIQQVREGSWRKQTDEGGNNEENPGGSEAQLGMRTHTHTRRPWEGERGAASR